MPEPDPGWLCRLWAGLARAVFPPRCLGCGRFIEPVTADGSQPLPNSPPGGGIERLAGVLCPGCRSGFQAIRSPLCTACGIPFEGRRGGDHLCGDCLQSPPRYRRARAAGIYGGGLRTALRALKYGGKVRLADPLGTMIFEAFERFFPGRIYDLVIPVPLHPRRLRRRGFNQSRLLMRAWPLPPADGVLVRVRSTPTQTGMNRRQRRRNIRGAFEVPDRRSVADGRVLLVDDVYTTGATVNECARMLKAAGAHRVDVITLARAL